MLVIIPFYNEENRISVQEYNRLFSEYKEEKFMLVDDASTDNTLKLLHNFQENFQNVSAYSLQKNAGKAEAIRKGVLHSKTQRKHIAYLDADLATPVEELYKMKIFLSENPTYVFVMGSRIKRLGSCITRYAYRHYLGRVIATIISSVILKIPVYDTQCGAKIIETKLALELFREPFVSKWLFDVELLLRFKKNNSDFDRFIYEYPLSTWTEKGGSKIRFTDFIKIPYDLIKIHFRYA